MNSTLEMWKAAILKLFLIILVSRREHVALTIADPEYWSFSFDEMGQYDLPAAFNYILNLTASPDLTYVGHSMGTVMFWAAMNQVQQRSEKPPFE